MISLTLNNEMTIINININEFRFIRREYIIPGQREFTVAESKHLQNIFADTLERILSISGGGNRYHARGLFHRGIIKLGWQHDDFVPYTITGIRGFFIL